MKSKVIQCSQYLGQTLAAALMVLSLHCVNDALAENSRNPQWPDPSDEPRAEAVGDPERQDIVDKIVTEDRSASRQLDLTGQRVEMDSSSAISSYSIDATATTTLNNDNVKQPFMAVYKGSNNGVMDPHGIIEVEAYGDWLNRATMWAEDYQPKTSWDAVEGEAWQLDPWANWVKAAPGRRLVLGVTILPGPKNGSGPTIGIRAGIPVSLEQGAAGAYNSHFRKLAENLVRRGLGRTILRLGWEFNGGWYAWGVANNAKADAFAAYWRQIVNTMRSVPGGEALVFDWNVSVGWCNFDPERAWPGNSYVHFVGIDTYDESWAANTYPYPAGSTPEQKLAIQKYVWSNVLLTPKFGLIYWRQFASRHNKMLTIPEWGVSIRSNGHGGGDNPYYIEQMYKFINDPTSNIRYHSYFDYQAGDARHQLAPTLDGVLTTEFPNVSLKFRELFSIP